MESRLSVLEEGLALVERGGMAALREAVRRLVLSVEAKAIIEKGGRKGLEEEIASVANNLEHSNSRLESLCRDHDSSARVREGMCFVFHDEIKEVNCEVEALAFRSSVFQDVLRDLPEERAKMDACEPLQRQPGGSGCQY